MELDTSEFFVGGNKQCAVYSLHHFAETDKFHFSFWDLAFGIQWLGNKSKSIGQREIIKNKQHVSERQDLLDPSLHSHY
jgi:hypothetical protein